MLRKQLQLGFTLVELLVVVVILSILVTVVYIDFGEVRAISRDTLRQQSLEELQIALELYKNQQGRYPHAGCESTPNDNASKWVTKGAVSGDSFVSCDEYIAGLTPDYLSVLPLDPGGELNTNAGFAYRVSPDGQSYKVWVKDTVEVNLVDGFDHPLARCPNMCTIGDWCGAGGPRPREYAVFRGPDSACW